jgi:hypothetical protein
MHSLSLKYYTHFIEEETEAFLDEVAELVNCRSWILKPKSLPPERASSEGKYGRLNTG